MPNTAEKMHDRVGGSPISVAGMCHINAMAAQQLVLQ